MRTVVTILAAAFLAAPTVRAGEAPRIVTAGSAVTEIAVALGLAPQIVAVDTSSRHLDETRDKPDVGYMRTLGAEGVLAQNPDLVIVSSEAGPPPVIGQIRGAGVRLVVVQNGRSLDNIDDKIRSIAAATGREAEGEAIIARFESELDGLRRLVAGQEGSPSVVYLHARQGGELMAAGTDTAADAMIGAIGARNACGSFTGYKPLSAEFFATSAPDCVIVSESVVGGDDELLAAVPGLAATPAGRNMRIIRVDDAAFLGFGPRSAATAAKVAAGLRRL